jgi:hypothetical protein
VTVVNRAACARSSRQLAVRPRVRLPLEPATSAWLHSDDKLPTLYLSNHDRSQVAWQSGTRGNQGAPGGWFKTQPLAIALFTSTGTGDQTSPWNDFQGNPESPGRIRTCDLRIRSDRFAGMMGDTNGV